MTRPDTKPTGGPDQCPNCGLQADNQTRTERQTDIGLKITLWATTGYFTRAQTPASLERRWEKEREADRRDVISKPAEYWQYRFVRVSVRFIGILPRYRIEASTKERTRFGPPDPWSTAFCTASLDNLISLPPRPPNEHDAMIFKRPENI